MNSARSAVFLIHLVQDVNILRPLIFMAARDYRLEVLLLVSTKFVARDTLGIWRHELEEILARTGARAIYFDDDWEAQRELCGQGLLFSASESHLPNHATTHDLFRHAPAGYLKVTLQHGFECVGFRHSADHDRAHGKTASFAADIVCSWGDRSPSMAPAQHSKLHVTGPTSVLQMPVGRAERVPGAPGIVCENLHSVRFMGAADTRLEFVKTFTEFSRLMAKRKREIRLRAHPGGQFFLRNHLGVPANVKVENAPLYRLDLRQFSYGISAPSSVVIDMLLAEIPTAVWTDPSHDLDASNYSGLTIVSSARDWERFAREAERDPAPFLAVQKRFLAETGMVLDPNEVYARYCELFEAALRMELRQPGSIVERERILLVADEKLPFLDEMFVRPLEPLIARGAIVTASFSARTVRGEAGQTDSDIHEQLDSMNPSVIVFCGVAGPITRPTLAWARREKVPVIYWVTEDFGGPSETPSSDDWIATADPSGGAPSDLLSAADLIYVPARRLETRLLSYFPDRQRTVEKFYFSRSKSAGKQASIQCLREEVLDVIARARAAASVRAEDSHRKEVCVCQLP